MTKNNYTGWNIKSSEFPEDKPIQEQISFILRYGILAPSGHNSQPWVFKIESNSVTILYEKERSLTESDPEGKILSISTGCLLKNIEVAANFFGFSHKIQIPEAFYDPITITFTRTGKTLTDNEDLIKEITERSTNRDKYLNKQIPNEFVNLMESSGDDDVKVYIVSDSREKGKKDELSQIMISSQIAAMESKKFRKELSNFVISNYSGRGTGMPGFTLGLPGPISIVAPKLIKKINLSRVTKKQDENILKNHTPAIAIIAVKKNKRVSLIKAGKLFEHIWLLATKNNLSFSPLAAAAQIPKFRQETKRLLNTAYEPAILFRVGYSNKKITHSPRLTLESITT